MSDHFDDDMKAALAKSRSKIQLLPHPGCRSHQHKNIAHLRHVIAAFAEHDVHMWNLCLRKSLKVSKVSKVSKVHEPQETQNH